MAKKPNKPIELTFQDIVLNANAEIIRQALEAREKIDVLLVEREEAYRRIAELESEVEKVIGEESTFPFPAPAMPVAGYDKTMPATLVKAKSEKAVEKPLEQNSAEVNEIEIEIDEFESSEPEMVVDFESENGGEYNDEFKERIGQNNDTEA